MNTTTQNKITDLIDTPRPSLPIMKVVSVESIPYALRLTPYAKYGSDEIKEFLSTFDDYVFVKEESKKAKEHYHAVLYSSKHEDDIRESVREFLRKYFPGPPKRGDANKQYNLSEVQDHEMALVYMFKDSCDFFCSDNINQNVLKELSKKSYKKFSKEDFAKQLEDLKAKFKSDDPPLGEMMVAVAQLKALYRQPVNMTYIHQMCLSCRIHNRPDRAEEIVSEFLSRFK